MEQSVTPLPVSARIVQGAFWILLFIAFPLALNPAALALNGSIEQGVLMPKALVLGVAWVLGVVALLLGGPKVSLAGLKRWPLAVTGLLLFAVFLIVDSWLVPGNVAVTLLGSAGRWDGFMIQAAWYSLAPIAAGLVYANAGRVRAPLVCLWIGAAVAALWGLMQAYGLEPLTLFGFDIVGNGQAVGPLALTGLLAGYLAVVLAVYFGLRQQFRWPNALFVALLAAALIATENRTAPAALALVYVGLLLFRGLRRRGSHFKQLLAYGAVAVVAATTVYVTQPDATGQLERTARLLQGGDTSFQTRLVFWSAGVPGALDRPLTGSGPNGFNGVFWRHADPEAQRLLVSRRLPAETERFVLTSSPVVYYYLPGQSEPQLTTIGFDKAHNYFLDVAIGAGLPATLLLLFAVVAGLWTLLRSEQQVARAVALGIVVYMIFGLTWFATLAVDPIVWGLFGVGIGAAWAERDAKTMASEASAEEASDLPPRSASEAAS